MEHNGCASKHNFWQMKRLGAQVCMTAFADAASLISVEACPPKSPLVSVLDRLVKFLSIVVEEDIFPSAMLVIPWTACSYNSLIQLSNAPATCTGQAMSYMGIVDAPTLESSIVGGFWEEKRHKVTLRRDLRDLCIRNASLRPRHPLDNPNLTPDNWGIT